MGYGASRIERKSTPESQEGLIFLAKANMLTVLVSIFFANTVKPVYNGHPWDLKKAAVRQRCLIKLRF